MQEKSQMEYKSDLRKLIGESIQELVGESNLPSQFKFADIVLEHPAEKSHGDLSTPVALSLFSQPGRPGKLQSPHQLAEALAEIIKKRALAINTDQEPRQFATKTPTALTNLQVSTAQPGFINFTLSEDFLTSQMAEIIRSRVTYPFKQRNTQKRLLEHTSPNPNKAMHLGHLRTNLVGMALGRVWQKVGYEVIFDAVDNNRGIAIAKLMWGFLKFARQDGQTITDIAYWQQHQDEWHTPESTNLRSDKFMDQLYVKGAEDFEASEDTQKQVRQMVIDWEAGESNNRQLWAQVLEYVHQGQAMTLGRLGSHWDIVWHEHEHYQLGKDLVEEGLKKGIFCKLDDGAVITNLEKDYGLTDTIVQKSDGTSLYITQDIALTKLKMEKVKPDHAYWVIGPEQTLAMKQLFAICEQLGIARLDQLTHIFYGYISLKGQGKMSSRKGTVVYIDDLLDQATEMVKKVILASGANSETYTAEIAEKIGVGAVKYSILKTGRLQDIAFDLNDAVQLTGNAGPYLQYTYVRCYNLIAKLMILMSIDTANLKNSDIAIPFDTFLNNKAYLNYQWQAVEVDILRNLYKYYEILELTASELAPQYLCTYLYELSQQFNSFYASQPILAEIAENDRENGELVGEARLEKLPVAVQARVLLVLAVALVIQDGLQLLGIETVEQM